MSAPSPDTLVVYQNGVVLRTTREWQLYTSYAVHILLVAPFLFYVAFLALHRDALSPWVALPALTLALLSFGLGIFFFVRLFQAKPQGP